jgi:hypothetical protein
MGEEMFVMWRLGNCELAFGHDLNVVHVYNEMHARYIVWVEWGISGLKQKWKRLMKCFNLQSPYNHLFKVVLILINFLHRSYLNFRYEIIGEHIDNLITYSWDQNF